MNDEQLKPKDKITDEIFSDGYFRRAQIRARRRKSPWNLILIPLVIVGIGFVFYLLLCVMWRIHTFIYPEHAGHFSEFWSKGVSLRSFISSFLLLIPLFFAALPLGMLIANLIAWCIPPARRVFARESKGHKHTSFTEAITGLLILSLIIVPICLLLSFIGALTLKSLK